MKTINELVAEIRAHPDFISIDLYTIDDFVEYYNDCMDCWYDLDTCISNDCIYDEATIPEVMISDFTERDRVELLRRIEQMYNIGQQDYDLYGKLTDLDAYVLMLK